MVTYEEAELLDTAFKALMEENRRLRIRLEEKEMPAKLVIVCDRCNTEIKARHLKCIKEHGDACPYCGCKMGEYKHDHYGPHCL
jgi:DNA-directed RNA polymerase subunit RPC12/RpoP